MLTGSLLVSTGRSSRPQAASCIQAPVALPKLLIRKGSKLAEDLQRKGYVARTIGIKLRYDDFRIATRDQTMAAYTADGKIIRTTAGLCLKRVPLTQKLRLLGVRASALLPAAQAADAGQTEETRYYKQKIPVALVIRAQAAPDLIATDQLF